jgi:arylsulfatase A-like enzyme
VGQAFQPARLTQVGKPAPHYTEIFLKGGHRVPFIVRWPGRTTAGTVNQSTVCLNDVMATFSDAFGMELPETAAVDSESFLAGLDGTWLSRSPLVHSCYGNELALRSGPWKIHFTHEEIKLFNLATDQREKNNVADQYPERVRELSAALIDIVSRGRSTPGPNLENDCGTNRWKGLEPAYRALNK